MYDPEAPTGGIDLDNSMKALGLIAVFLSSVALFNHLEARANHCTNWYQVGETYTSFDGQRLTCLPR